MRRRKHGPSHDVRICSIDKSVLSMSYGASDRNNAGFRAHFTRKCPQASRNRVAIISQSEKWRDLGAHLSEWGVSDEVVVCTMRKMQVAHCDD
ncbi:MULTISPECIES: hypothetical protein [unclassified Bradyrhizobium]